MQDSAHLVDALTTLLQSCGLVQSQESRSQSRRRSFSDGIKVHPGPRKLPLASTLLSQSAIAQAVLLSVRRLWSAWLLAAPPALQDHCILQCQVLAAGKVGVMPCVQSAVGERRGHG